MITTATRRAYSFHVLRAHLCGFRPLTLDQFAAVAFTAQRFF